MKNKKNKLFTFVDLFAGIGGFRVALENNGGICKGYSEIDNQAIQTYEQNFLNDSNCKEVALGNIVITGDKIEKNLQDSISSVQVFDENHLAKAEPEDLIKFAFSIVSSSLRFNCLRMLLFAGLPRVRFAYNPSIASLSERSIALW